MATLKKAKQHQKKIEKKQKERAIRKSMRKVIKTTESLAFEEQIDNRINEMKAKPPKTKRWFERLTQLSLKKEINHYTIKFRTSWDKKRSRFNVTGKLWIMVVVAVPGVGEEVKLIRQFRRIPGFEIAVQYFLIALDLELKARPSDTKGRFMELVMLDKRTTVWRSVQYDKNKEEKLMFQNLPSDAPFYRGMCVFMKKKQYEWTHYQEVLREKRKVLNYESDIRKTWDIEYPENAVPVR